MIRGYTFDYQTIDAKADARLLRSIFRNQDGRIFGCAVSIRGLAGLLIEPGDFIMCGRHLAFDEAVVVPTTACTAQAAYARICLRIDLSNIPSHETFTQCEVFVDESTALNGFRTLTTEDINAAGSVYEIEVATVKLDATRHIEAIESSWRIISPTTAAGRE